MYRYICTVFVALTICQAAIASVDIQHKIVELKLDEQMSQTNDLLDADFETTLNTGDFIFGTHEAGDGYYYLDYEYDNNEYVVMHLELHVPLPEGKKITFISAKNKPDSNVAICGHMSDVGTSKVVVLIRIPTYVKANIRFVITAK